MLALQNSSQFDAEKFFKGLRLAGSNPRTNGSAISQSQDGRVDWVSAERWIEWAHLADPSRSMQIAYAKEAWASREDGALCVYLG